METAQRMHIGQQIRDARAARRMSQKTLAELAGVAPNTLGAIERGESVQRRNLLAVMTALGLTLESPTPDAGPDRHTDIAIEAVTRWMGALPPDRRLDALSWLLAALRDAPEL